MHLQKDDKEAFNVLYWKFHSAIFSNVLKLTRDSLIAEDIVQEVFISLWEKRYQIDPGQEIAGWLFVVSYNKSVSHLKRKLKESLAHSIMQQPFEVAIDEGHDLAYAQVNLLAKAIEQLSPQKRRVFELCKLQQKTYMEAAEELKLSKHTVKEYLQNAVISIKEYIKQHPEFTSLFFWLFSFDSFH